jgi:catechol 2,3-dioxygenase-like lactoylglutathione lyase family enzyme
MKWMRTAVLLWIAVAVCAAEDLTLMGLAHVGIRVSDLERARTFYGGVLGFENAFTTKKDDGSVFVAYMKVNDHQFIELFPGLKPEDTVPITHIAMWTEDLEKSRQIMLSRGLTPTEIHKGRRDHNLSFSLRQLPGQNLVFLEFVQYMPDSLHMLSKGKSLGARRLSAHLEHAGIITTDLDAALRFYVERLGFKETWRRINRDSKRVALIHLRMPGPSGDYIELSNQSGNTSPTRARAGSAAHCSLEVPDIKAAYQATLDRGETKDPKEPRFGLDLRWQFNLFDADGTRVELMQPRAKDTTFPPVAYAN